jgi:hypothetical protein
MSEAARKAPVGRVLQDLIFGIDADMPTATADLPHLIRARLQTALSPRFFLDCADLLLYQMAFEPAARFLYSDPSARYTLQLFCWPPGFGNQPHLHENWTVSAVLSHSLLVFRSSVSEADCAASTPFLAIPGRAGVLIPPQFHCLRNIGNETAITFHAFGMNEDRGNKTQHERRSAVSMRIDDAGILAIAREAAKTGEAGSRDVLISAFLAAGNATKLELMKLMVKLDPMEAVRMGRTLSRLVGGRDGRRLLRLVEKLDVAVCTEPNRPPMTTPWFPGNSKV